MVQATVLQETRIFNDNHVDPRRCQQVITKLLYLLTQGESLTKARSRRPSPLPATPPPPSLAPL